MRRIAPLAAMVLVAACSSASGSPPAPSAGAPSPATTAAATAATPAAATPVPTLGATRTDVAGVEQVWVPSGSFRMGSTDDEVAAVRAADPPPWMVGELRSEQPAHDVTISDGFWIDRTEVTNAAFKAFVDAGGYDDRRYWSDAGWAWVDDLNRRGLPMRCPGDAPDVPRRCITWYEAEAYAAWRGGALPSEAQWEYAARGPDAPVYPWGDAWDPARANVVGSDAPVAVGTLPGGASWVGAQDMAGNAMEWVADWLDTAYYATSPTADPPGPTRGTKKVEKGGWFGSDPAVARAAYRHFEDPPTYGDKHIGFRVVSD